MESVLLFSSLGVAVIDWFAVRNAIKPLEYFAKPAMMVLLLAWFYLETGFEGAALYFGIGLVLSLLGDVFLMLPKEMFIAGLVSFLLAHVAYILGFLTPFPGFSLTWIAFILFLAVSGSQIYMRISQGLKGKHAALKAPVLIYTVVISIMVLSALLTLTSPDWRLTAALLGSIGAILFYASDAILALNKFTGPIRNGRLMNMIAYHLGQLCIAGAAVMQFAGG
jgi:uncharacterized membrane protein YhhN